MWWLWATALASEWALVASGASLYAAPRASDDVAWVAGPPLLVEVTARRDNGWVELRTRPAPPRTCRQGDEPPAEIELVLWAPASSLVPVLRRRVETADLVAEAGWAPDEAVPQEAWARAQLSKDVFGDTFEPAAARESADGLVRVDPSTFRDGVQLGGAVVQLDLQRVSWIEVPRGQPDRLQVVSQDGCLTVRADGRGQLPAWRASSDGGAIGGVIGGPLHGAQRPDAPRPTVHLDAGAAMTWADGAPAGVVRTPVDLPAAAALDGRACVHWALSTRDSAPRLTLCTSPATPPAAPRTR